MAIKALADCITGHKSLRATVLLFLAITAVCLGLCLPRLARSILREETALTTSHHADLSQNFTPTSLLKPQRQTTSSLIPQNAPQALSTASESGNLNDSAQPPESATKPSAALSFCPPTLDTEPGLYVSGLIFLTLGIPFILVIMLILILKRHQWKPHMSSSLPGCIKHHDSLRLAQSCQIHLIQVHDILVVVGTDQQGLKLICPLSGFGTTLDKLTSQVLSEDSQSPTKEHAHGTAIE